MFRLTSERGFIVVINAMILLIMAVLFGFSVSRNHPEPILWLIVFAPPILAILSALSLRDRVIQRIAYFVAAATMLPAVWFGIWGGWGLLYAVAIIFFVVTAFGGTASR